ncbi:unnamed protein product [Urochloa humidicola]
MSVAAVQFNFPFPQDASRNLGDFADWKVVDSLEANPNAAQAYKSEAAHQGFPSEPPLDLSEYPDPFRSLGWDRLLPYDLDNPCGPYEIYLEEFYNIHKSPPVSAADAALLCLEKENHLRLWWKSSRNYYILLDDNSLSENIEDGMIQFALYKQDESKYPFILDAAACIAKEAELMIEWLRLGYELPNEEYMLSQEIRNWAYRLVMFQGKWSPYIAAVLLGIKKEAEWLIENLRGSCDTDTSMQIRQFATQYLWCKLECESEYPSEGSSEMASEIVDDTTEVNQPTWGNMGEVDSVAVQSEIIKKQPNNNSDGYRTNVDESSDTSSLSEEEWFAEEWQWVTAHGE